MRARAQRQAQRGPLVLVAARVDARTRRRDRRASRRRRRWRAGPRGSARRRARCAPETRAPAGPARRPRCWPAPGRCRRATSPRLPTRVATVVMRLSARFSSAVATASGSTSSARPRAAGHSSAAAIDRMPDPQPRSTNRSTWRAASSSAIAITSRVEAWPPVPNARPGSMSITRSVAAAGGASQLGRMTKLRPTRSARKYRFQTSRHSSSCGLAARDRHRVGRHARGAQARAGGLDLGDDLVLDVGRALREDQRPPTLDAKDGLGVADLDPARQRADGVSEHLGRGRRNLDRELDPIAWTRGRAQAQRQRTMRRFASRRRRLRASRILRLRFTEGFS